MRILTESENLDFQSPPLEIIPSHQKKQEIVFNEIKRTEFDNDALFHVLCLFCDEVIQIGKKDNKIKMCNNIDPVDLDSFKICNRCNDLIIGTFNLFDEWEFFRNSNTVWLSPDCIVGICRHDSGAGKLTLLKLNKSLENMMEEDKKKPYFQINLLFKYFPHATLVLFRRGLFALKYDGVIKWYGMIAPKKWDNDDEDEEW